MIPSALATHFKHSIEPTLSKFIKPPILSLIATKMPQRLNTMVVEKLLNSAFKEQIDDGDFEFLEGRLLQIEIIDANLFLGLSFKKNKMNCFHFNKQACQSDVTLSIETLDAISLIQQEVDPDTLFFQRKLKIKGDTDLAHHVKNTIDTLDPEKLPTFVLKIISEYKNRVLCS